MPFSSALKRSAAVTGLVGAAALLAPAIASADTAFDSPAPTTYMCPATITASDTFARAVADQNGVVEYGLHQPLTAGTNVVWINTNTGQWGNTPLTPTEATHQHPVGVANTGTGTVAGAIYGMYTDADGHTCVLLPGVNYFQAS